MPGRNGNDVEGTAATFNLDFSATYELQRQPARSPSKALNLTDEFQDQWVDLTAGPAVVLSPHRTPVLPRHALQVLTA